jgi:hypothetical protein
MGKAKEEKTALDLLGKAHRQRELEAQRAVWKIFGVDYEAEKQKQRELYVALREQGADRMLKTRGGGGRRQHRDLKKFREFCKKILGLETQELREDIVKQLKELAEEAHQSAMDRRLKASTRVKWARVEAYIYQVISGITKQYDVVEINKRIAELKELVERELGQRARKAGA